MSTSADSPVVRPLTVADLTDIVELQKTVAPRLPAGFVRFKSESELRLYLDGTLGVAYGVVEGAALVAMSLLRIPDEKHPNEGLRFALASPGVVVAAGLGEIMAEEDWALYTCFLENAMVLPEARGRGYQRALLDARLAHAVSAKMRWICAGAHLQNSVSWTNLLAKGMAIAGMRFDAGYPIVGLLRSFDKLTLAAEPSDRVSVSAHDHSQHQAALRNGYIGLGLASDGAVIYRRLARRARRRALKTESHNHRSSFGPLRS